MNEKNRANYYAIIPAKVRYDKNLKPAEKILYGELTALSNKNGYCHAEYDHMYRMGSGCYLLH